MGQPIVSAFIDKGMIDRIKIEHEHFDMRIYHRNLDILIQRIIRVHRDVWMVQCRAHGFKLLYQTPEPTSLSWFQAIHGFDATLNKTI